MNTSYDPACLQVNGDTMKRAAATARKLFEQIVTAQAVSSQVFRTAIEELTTGTAQLTGEQPLLREEIGTGCCLVAGTLGNI